MSERGTFCTSYLYDYPVLVPVLRRLLPAICRKWEGSLVEIRPPGAESEEKARAFMGVMHGTYGGEEAMDMEFFILDELLPQLPVEHGDFSISVLPEDESTAAVFTVKGHTVTRRKLADPTVVT